MVSTQFAAMGIALVLAYIFLYYNKNWYVRLSGCFGIMIISVAFGVIEDTIPMFVLMATNLLIALLKLVEMAGELIGRVQ